MNGEKTNGLLNRLLVMHSCSLANFLAYAQPWWPAEHAQAIEVLADILADQESIATRVGELILSTNGVVASGQFPDRFSDLHDQSFGYMLAELIRYQDRTVAAIEQLVRQLPPASPAQELAQEALGKSKAHRDMLSDLRTGAASGPAGGR